MIGTKLFIVSKISYSIKVKEIMKTDKIYRTLCILSMIIIVWIITLSSCGTVDKATTHSCELMEKGQKCLPDHSCCK